jgi:phosphoglycerate dehydrogenase-like enzyme
MPQVIVSPHMAGDFAGWREATSRQFVENLDRWLKGHELAHVVDKRRGYVSRERVK